MKYFSATTTASIETYCVNMGEYSKSTTVQEVATKLAPCIESSFTNVHAGLKAEMDVLLASNDERVAVRDAIQPKFTPNEWSKILQVALFFVSILESDDYNGRTAVCMVSNLNDGKNFTWVHSVC